MATPATARAKAYVERRRSVRLPRNITFVVSGESTGERWFQERAFTLSVNAHGALIGLTTHVVLGQTLFLMNLKTWIKREGRVIRLGALQGEWTQVAIEFVEPALEFWSFECSPKRSLKKN